MVRQYYEQGAHVLLVDTGNSYQGLCSLIHARTHGAVSYTHLVVIVADTLELVVEIGQADVVVHRCLIDFNHLDFVSEKQDVYKRQV